MADDDGRAPEDEDAVAPGTGADEIVPLVYETLRALAAHQLGPERDGHTLQPTALVHECYLRLVDQEDVRWKSRQHFCAVASRVIRRVLVDHARRRAAAKRGGRWLRVSLHEDMVVSTGPAVDLVALDAALERLRELAERQVRIVEMRFFGGLTNEEAAEVLGISLRTVVGEWTAARAWLRRELASSD